MAERRVGRLDKIKFKQFIVALIRKLKIEYHGINVIDDEAESYEVSDSDGEPFEDDELYDEYNAPEYI